MFERPESPEVQKYRKLAEKYKNVVHYLIHKISHDQKSGQRDTIIFASKSLENTKVKAKEEKDKGSSIIVAKIDPLQKSAKWIYCTEDLRKHYQGKK